MIEKLTSKKDIEKCVDMYLPHETWLNSDRNSSLQAMHLICQRGYAHVFKKDGEIIAFILAMIEKPSHMSIYVLRQLYFCSIGGVSGVRAMLLLHADMVRYAEERSIPLVISCGSHFDEENKFTKALEKHGWERRGYAAAYKTKYYKPPDAYVACKPI